MAKSNKRPLAVFNIGKVRRIGAFIIKVKGIVLNIANNVGIFATPKPTLPSVTVNIGKLDDAEVLAQTRVKGSAAARDEKYEVVLDDVRGLQGYVQELADKAADELTAIAIINASGFDLKVNGVFQKPPLAAKNGKLSGEVKLVALGGGPRTSHDWQMSNDGVVWVNLPSTIKCTTMVENLSPLSAVQFRHRLIRSTGPEGWSQVVSIAVV